jgi:hypothetical protein
MNRRQRRDIKKTASKKLTVTERKMNTIKNKVMSVHGQDPFEEVNERKTYFRFINYFKTGLKMFPTHTYRLGSFMYRYNPENTFIAWFGYVLKIKDWTLRSKVKPPQAIGKYLIDFRKNKRPVER